jgi:alanine racemase
MAVDDVARAAGTIGYEILTSMGCATSGIVEDISRTEI